MTENEQFWGYDHFSGLISQFPSEAVAIYYAERNDEYIVFVATLHDLVEYPYAAGDKTILGPGVELEDHAVTVNDRTIYYEHPRREGNKTLLGPHTELEGYVITAQGQTYYRTCDVWVVMGESKCIMPVQHPSNQHEDRAGNTRYNLR